MPPAIDQLTEREKQALRLLLSGHDAKSTARALDLSVHTVNDRLREARRKLGVSSSREAARLLARSENHAPDNSAHMFLGIAAAPGLAHDPEQPGPGNRAGRHSLWLGGGILMISVIFVAMLMMAPENETARTAAAVQEVAATAALNDGDAASADAARQWLLLLDGGDWNQSWRSSGTLFRAQLSRSGWAATIKPVRAPLGAPTKRVLGSVTKTGSLPGVPAGDYEVLEYRTDFANRRGAIETVVLARENAGWGVVGYFIR